MKNNETPTKKTEEIAHISKAFEDTFLKQTNDLQMLDCGSYELALLFDSWLPDHQPILEAGCGSGKWVVWFMEKVWQSIGLDWSEKLLARTKKEFAPCMFLSGKMGAMLFSECAFGSIVALGSIEHSADGPDPALKEFR